MDKKEKLAKAKEAMKEINKKHKKVVLDFANNQGDWKRQDTGIEKFDNFTGGWAYGHSCVLWGQAGGGKSTLMYHTIVQAQKEDKIVAFIDLEDSFEKIRAASLGVNLDDLIIGHYEVAEQALDTVLTFAREEIVDMIILDSLHNLAPKGMIEDKKGIKSLEQKNMALLPRVLSEFFTRATTLIFNANIALILIGQTRIDLGGFIALSKLSGGNSLIHNSVLTVYTRQGKGVNAPVQKIIEYFLDPDGKLHKKTREITIGCDIVMRIDKKKLPNCKAQKSEIHLPFYFDTGFIAPPEEEIKEIITGTEEEKIKINQMLEEKREKIKQKEDKIKLKIIGKDNKELKLSDEYKYTGDKTITILPEKKGRGRPKKEKIHRTI